MAHHHPIARMFRPKTPYCTKRIASVWQRVYTWFPHAVNLGTFNCRPIADSTTWSEHAWADAWDVSSPQTVKLQTPDAYLDQIVRFIKSLPPKVGVSQILYRIKNHYSHAHVDVEPNYTGTPPCAQIRR
jgi:hypothetical protein